MPLLTIHTNQTLSTEQQDELIHSASQSMAELLGKPESYVMVLLQSGQAMAFAGSREPCAYLELKSLGLPEERTPHFSAALCKLIAQHTGIVESRIYIEFAAPARHMWGWDGHTF